MKPSLKRSISVVVLAMVASAVGVQAQTTLWIDPVNPPSGSINPAGLVTLEVRLDGITAPASLVTYQAMIEVVPLSGATGTLVAADPAFLPSPDDESVFVDVLRADWVFAGAGGAIAAGESSQLKIGATLLGGVGVTVSDGYCGTFILQASNDASGDFEIRFVLEVESPTTPGLMVPATFLTGADYEVNEFTDIGTTVSVVVAAAYDDCGDAGPVPVGVTPFSNVNSTTDGPALDPSCDEANGNGVSFEQDVWFEHTASCDGILTISTCNDADFDTRIAVYGSGSSTCACPADNSTLLACDDDSGGCGATSEVVLSANQGDCYLIRLGGPFGAEGTGNITITCAPDLCTDASPISVGPTISGSTENTSVNDDLGVDCGGGLPDSPGVWYSVTGTGNLMTADLFNGSFDTRLTVYEGGCAALSCVGDDDAAGSSQESVDWCSTMGTNYLILVHGVGRATGTFDLRVTDRNCNDGNSCTTDECVSGTCVNTPTYEVGVECCNPFSGSIELIDDGNPCTNDVCSTGTGAVTHPPVSNGVNAACDDRNPCTVDACQTGLCINTDVNGDSCSVDGDCLAETATCVQNVCECIGATLELNLEPGVLPTDGCYVTGQTMVAYVDLGPADSESVSPLPIVGAQFFLEYDPATLLLTSIDPGVVADPTSPFALEFNETVDPVAGTIDYMVAVNFGSAGTQLPTTVAVLQFDVLAPCQAYLRYRFSGPAGQRSLLSMTGGDQIEPILLDAPPIQINSTGPSLSACPGSVIVGPDPGALTATVTWTDPTASDACAAGAVPVTCDPPNGSVFLDGTTQVTCTATNSCGMLDLCSFDVTVELPIITVDVELSATMAAGPITRCITFDLWDCDGPPGIQHLSVTQELSFTGGLATAVDVPIPGGQWECLTARDELHSLRSTAADFTTADGIFYTASFVGSRASGGHWLVGGNLNDDNYIDILDFGVFFPLYLTQAAADTPCGTLPPHANINGDNVVDISDLVFVTGNSLLASEPNCCGAGAVAGGNRSGPVTSITVQELRSRGLGDMAVADLNGDGVLDFDDLAVFFQGGTSPPDNDGSLRDPRIEAGSKPGRTRPSRR